MPAVVTFDGPNRIINEISTGGDNTLDILEVYSEWKEWVRLSDNAKFFPAFAQSGGAPLSPGVNQATYYFLTNGWRIRPAELNHSLTLNGNLFVDGGVGDPTVDTLGTFNVRVNRQFSNLTETVNIAGSSGVTLPELQNELDLRNVVATILDVAISTRVEQATFSAEVRAALTAQGYTVTRGANLDNLDASVAGVPGSVRDISLATTTSGTLGQAISIIEGIAAKNRMLIDNFSYDANGFATAARVRVFGTPAQAAAATSGGVGEGEIMTTIVSGVPDATFPQLPTTMRGVGQ